MNARKIINEDSADDFLWFLNNSSSAGCDYYVFLDNLGGFLIVKRIIFG